MKLAGGQVFDSTKGFILRDLCVENGLITQDADSSVDVSGCYLIPGLTDLHFHGCVGEDFSDASAEGLRKMADYELSRGITQICPAGMTLSEEILTDVCKTAAAHKAAGPGGARSW
jgi:N-acetylglucosamine-6-phosphate deacetylase